MNHKFVGTEHLLLGLIKLGQGVAVNVLQKMGLDLETVRMNVENCVGSGPREEMVGNIPYTPRVKQVLVLAGKEARALNHSYVGTEHILLGLLREGEGIAARVLKNLEVDIERTRNEILKELDPNCSDSYRQPDAFLTAGRQEIGSHRTRPVAREEVRGNDLAPLVLAAVALGLCGIPSVPPLSVVVVPLAELSLIMLGRTMVRGKWSLLRVIGFAAVVATASLALYHGLTHRHLID